MAEEKKSFVLYSDLLSVVEKLVKKDREEKTNYAGELFFHILEYVNDKEPIPIDFIIEMAFEPIKLQLKRDLKKWEVSKEDKVKNGIIGNLKRWQPDLYNKLNNGEITLEEAQEIARHRKASLGDNNNRPPSQNIANIAVNVNDSVSVNVNDSVIKEKKKKVFNFRLSLIELGVNEEIANDWMVVRKSKKTANTKTAFNAIKSQIEKSNKTPNECIKTSVENSWAGFKSSWMDNLNNSSNNNSKYESRTGHIHVTKKVTDLDFVDPNNL